MKRWIAVIVVVALGATGALVWWRGSGAHPGQEATAAPGASAGPGAAAESHPTVFTDRAVETGLVFDHFNGRSGELYYCEPVGSGAALLDYDADGDLDVFLVQGTMIGPGKTLADATDPFKGDPPPRSRLFRNDLSVGADGRRALHFTDVTDAAGLHVSEYGMGAAAADYDEDGWVDLYVTALGSNHMLRNQGDGTFADVTEKTGTGEDRWSASAAFFDYDKDGHLDLFVCNYLDFRCETNKPCFSVSSARDYCGPLSYEPMPNRLFRGRGDGTFADVSSSSRIASEFGGALGIICADFDRDLWVDLYIANDGRPNELWINQKDGTFRNQALLAGCAVDAEGRPEASMGADAEDFDNDGDQDIYLTHLGGQTNTFYVNDGNGFFEDRTVALDLAAPSLPYTGFGMAFLDFDGDGLLDLFVANGAIFTQEKLLREGDTYPLRQNNLLLRNQGGRFADWSQWAGDDFRIPEVSRGAAVGDLDNDGDTDVVVVNNLGRARLLINDVGATNPWIGFQLQERPGGRSPEGTLVEVELADGGTRWRRVRSVASYLCTNDARVLLGLGSPAPGRSGLGSPAPGRSGLGSPAPGRSGLGSPAPGRSGLGSPAPGRSGLGSGGAVARVKVHWLDGNIEVWNGLAAGRYHVLVKGAGDER